MICAGTHFGIAKRELDGLALLSPRISAGPALLPGRQDCIGPGDFPAVRQHGFEYHELIKKRGKDLLARIQATRRRQPVV